MQAAVCRARLVQFAPRLGAVEDNLRRHLEAAEAAASAGVDLVVFPELSLTGYYLRDLAVELALTLDSPVLAELRAVSRRVHLVCGFVEETPSYDLHCTAAYLADGEIRHLHRKVYLPTYGMFDEGRYFAPGEALRTFPTPWGPAGLLVCEDLWLPSAPYVLSRHGLDLLIAVAASPLRGVEEGGLPIQQIYEQLLGTYATLFQCHVLFCNRVGCEDGVTFWGGSRALSPAGGPPTVAPTLEECWVDVELRRSDLRQARLATPLLSDEKLDLTLRELGRIAHG